MKKFPLLPRKKNTDKRDCGHVLVVAGSEAYPGAAVLTARAALLSGAGLVTLATPASIRNAILKKFPPEVMPVFFKGSPFLKIQKLIRERHINVLAVGPGLGRAWATSKWVRALTKEVHVPVVLDADGLNAFEGRVKELFRCSAPMVITPHEREFSRLTGQAPETSSAKREALAKKFLSLYHGVLVLKGHRTLVASRGRLFRNTTGNPGMAKGGSGDVLTGIIAAFLAQGLQPFEAAVWGVYFHGLAGDLAVKKTGELSLTASDLIDSLKDCWSSSVGRAADL